MKKRALSLLLVIVMTFGLAAPAFAAELFQAEESAAREDTVPAPAAPADPVPEEEPAEEPAAPNMPAPASVTEPEAEDLPMPADAGEDFSIRLETEDGPVSPGYWPKSGSSAEFDSVWTELTEAAKDHPEYIAMVVLSGDVTTDSGLTWDNPGKLYIYASDTGTDVHLTGSDALGSNDIITIKQGEVHLGSDIADTGDTGPLTVTGNVTVSGGTLTGGKQVTVEGTGARIAVSGSGSATLNGGTYSPFSFAVENGGTLTCDGSSISALFINAGGSAELTGGTYSTIYVEGDGAKLTCSGGVNATELEITSTWGAIPGDVNLTGGTYGTIYVEGDGAKLTCSGNVNVTDRLYIGRKDNNAKTKDVKLSGGTYNHIGIHATIVGTLAEMLADGCCYADSDHYMITDGGVLNNTFKGQIYNVTVMQAPNYKAPEANDLTYDGEKHPLVTPGSAGMQYALKETEPAESEWQNDTTDLTGSEAGTYHVWWQVRPNGETAGVKGELVVTIKKTTVTVTEPTLARNMVYDGEARMLLDTAGSASSGTMLYATTEDVFHEPADDSWVDSKDLTGTDAGDYYIWYKVDGDPNHEGKEPTMVGYAPVMIDERAVTVTWSGDDYFTYDGDEHYPTPTLSGVLEQDKNDVKIVVSVTDSVNVGFHTATAKLEGTRSGNYEIPSGSGSKSYHIIKAEGTVTPPTALDRIYDEQSTALVTEGIVSGGRILYSLTGENYTADIPRNELKNADKDYTVYWKADANVNNYDFGGAPMSGTVKVTIQKAAAKNGSEYFHTLQEAVAKGGNVTLLASTALTGGIEITNAVTLGSDIGRSVTGAELTVAGSGSLTVTGNVTVNSVNVTGGSLTTAGGTFAALNVENVDPSTGMVNLKGGTYGLIKTRTSESLNSLLWSFYAFFKEDGTGVDHTGKTTLSDVVVRPIGYAAADQAPQAKPLTYNGGTAQELVSAGTAPHGTIMYAMTLSGSERPQSYAKEIPQAKEAGTYYVWWMVKGDACYYDYMPDAPIVVTIAPAPLDGVTPPKAVEGGLIYNGEPQELVTKGEAEGGTMWYALGTDAVTAPDKDAWRENDVTKITGQDAGTYYVWYKVVANDENHDDVGPVCISVTIGKAGQGTVAPPTPVEGGLYYQGTDQPLLTGTGAAANGKMWYAVTETDAAPAAGAAWKDDVTQVTAAGIGTYYVWYKVVGDKNHKDVPPTKIGEVVIRDAAANIGETYYPTFEEAVKAALEGEDKVITLRQSAAPTDQVQINDKVTLRSDRSVSVAGAGFNITEAGSLTVNEYVTVYGVKVGGMEVPMDMYGGETVTQAEHNGKTVARVEFGDSGNNSLRVGDTTVGGTKGDYVMVTDDGSVIVPLKAGEYFTLDGRTYTNKGETEACVTIRQDGTFVLDENVTMDIIPPAAGLRLAPNEHAVYTAGNKTVTLLAGPSGAAMDIDGDGNVNVTAGGVTMKGDVTAAENGGWATQLGDVTITVKAKDGTLIDGVEVTVKAVAESGGAHEASTVGGKAAFEDLPYGAYNVKIVYKVGHVELTVTDSLTVSRIGDAREYELDQLLVSTAVEGDRPPAVDNLADAIDDSDKKDATAANKTAIDIKLTSETQEKDNSAQQNAIRDKIRKELRDAADNTVTDYVDVTIMKETSTIGDDGTRQGTVTKPVDQTAKLLTLRFPISGTMRMALAEIEGAMEEHVFVFRYHGAAAEKMHRVSPGTGAKASYECYYLEDGCIVVRANKFSVYAFGVTEGTVREYTPSTGGGGYWPTVDKSKLNAAIAAAEALKEEDYTAESWTALETALAAARTVAAKSSPTQTEVDAALNALTTAQNALVKQGGEPGEDEPGPGDEIQPPAGGTGWRWVESEQTYYYFKDGKRVGDYWIGQAQGGSAWLNNWYYADANGRLLTGFQYLDDLKGGKAWYMLQTTTANGEMGKMLTGWQWTYDAAVGTGWFSPKYGSQGACTYTTKWGSYSAATGLWADGSVHIG